MSLLNGAEWICPQDNASCYASKFTQKRFIKEKVDFFAYTDIQYLKRY